MGSISETMAVVNSNSISLLRYCIDPVAQHFVRPVKSCQCFKGWYSPIINVKLMLLFFLMLYTSMHLPSVSSELLHWCCGNIVQGSRMPIRFVVDNFDLYFHMHIYDSNKYMQLLCMLFKMQLVRLFLFHFIFFCFFYNKYSIWYVVLCTFVISLQQSFVELLDMVGRIWIKIINP